MTIHRIGLFSWHTRRRAPALLAVICFAVTICFAALAPGASRQAARSVEPRFAVYDLYIETASAPLAAWQVELVDRAGAVMIVGLEGGEAGAFHSPPHYDPAALMTGRIILAAFSTAAAEALPVGRTRIASLHLHLDANGRPDFETTLTAVATVHGLPLRASVSLEPRHERPESREDIDE